MASSKKRRSSSLPLELVEEILGRVPLESLVRFRSICKEWYALFKDKRFIYKHFDFSHKRFIRSADKSIQLVDPETQAPMYLPLPYKFHRHVFRKTIHCDGLLLCSCTVKGRWYDDKSRKLAVWNPILRRVKWIKPSSSYSEFDVYGFGYDNVSREKYKILRFGKSSEVKIYEFKSKRWRSVVATETPGSCDGNGCYRKRLAVSMNGNMYWVVVHENKMDQSKTETFIKSFDFSTETFKPICCVPKGTDFFRVSAHHTVALSGFGGDRLSLLHQHRDVKIEVWVTNKVTDPVVSWSKFFNVTPPHLPILDSSFDRSFQTHFIHKTNKIMLWCEDEDYEGNCTCANFYEMGEGQIKNQVEVTRRGSWFDLSCNVYVPSLVPVPV